MSRAAAGVALLDVNVLIALAWPNHEAHGAARAWFDAHAHRGWATTPVTESGFVRVSSNRRALPTSTTPALAARLLTAMRKLPGHDFWADTVEVVTGGHLDLGVLTGHRQVTDAHLLALCAARSGRLVTLDRAVDELAAGGVGVEVIVPPRDG